MPPPFFLKKRTLDDVARLAEKNMSVSPSLLESSNIRIGSPSLSTFEIESIGNRLLFTVIFIPHKSLTLVLALNNCVYTQK